MIISARPFRKVFGGKTVADIPSLAPSWKEATELRFLNCVRLLLKYPAPHSDATLLIGVTCFELGEPHECKDSCMESLYDSSPEY